MKRIRVLIVDDGTEFGGSLVSTANLIRSLDRQRFEPILVTGVDRGLVASVLKEAAHTTEVAIVPGFLHPFRPDHVAARIRRFPGPFCRIPSRRSSISCVTSSISLTRSRWSL